MNDSVSGFIKGEGDLSSSEFTVFQEMSSRGFNRLVKVRRYGRWWVLKGLKPEYLAQSGFRELLRKEYDIAAQMHHRGVVEVAGFEDVDGIGPCIVMEWIDGQTLKEWLGAVPPVRQRKEVFCQLLDAVEYIHGCQTVHRDIKPSNILITRNGNNAKLIDFGLSDTDSHAVFKQSAGTTGYLSPEQERGDSTDFRNDIYSLGCVLEDLSLGMAAKSVVRRCKMPIEKRYGNVGALRKAFRHSMRVPYYILIVLLMVVLASALTFTARDNVMVDTVEVSDGDIFTVEGLKYKILSAEKRTLEVNSCQLPSGSRLSVLETIRYRNMEYRVIGIGEYAFWNSCLSEVNLPVTLKYISVGAFYNNNIRRLVVPDSVTLVGRGMVVRCDSMESLWLGPRVETIELHGFSACKNLRDIYIRTAKPPVATDLFGVEPHLQDNVTLHVPRGSENLYRNADEWRRFKKITTN